MTRTVLAYLLALLAGPAFTAALIWVAWKIGGWL